MIGSGDGLWFLAGLYARFMLHIVAQNNVHSEMGLHPLRMKASIRCTWLHFARLFGAAIFQPPDGLLPRDVRTPWRYDHAMTYRGPTPKEEMLLRCARIGFNPPA